MAVTFIDNLKLNQVILIRHGEPDIDFKEKYSYEEAIDYAKEYDRVGVRNIKTNPVKIMDYENVKVLSSPLPRAHETAKTLFPDKEIGIEPLFAEFNSQVMKLPGKHSTKTWLRVSAFFWFVGLYYYPDISPARQELKRVKEALNYIEKQCLIRDK
jgi:broad specificity phosphatase PhoE